MMQLVILIKAICKYNVEILWAIELNQTDLYLFLTIYLSFIPQLFNTQ